jgi:hypothetical protein
MLVFVRRDFHRGFLQHRPSKVVIRQIVVRVDKCEQRKGGENHDEYPNKFLVHSLSRRSNELSLPINSGIQRHVPVEISFIGDDFWLCYNPRPEENHMDVVTRLKVERDKVARQLSGLNTAIQAMSGLNTTRPSHGPRHMSAAAKARISASKMGKREKAESKLSYVSRGCQRLLDLRGEESLRMRAVAEPIITRTPPITSTNFTGRDYPRVQRTPLRNLRSGINRT